MKALLLAVAYLLTSSLPGLTLNQVDIVLKLQRDVRAGTTLIIKPNTRTPCYPVLSPDNPGYIQRYIESKDEWENTSLLSFNPQWAGNYPLGIYTNNLMCPGGSRGLASYGYVEIEDIIAIGIGRDLINIENY